MSFISVYIFVLCILFRLFMRFCVEKNSERSKREREREKYLEAEKMKENEVFLFRLFMSFFFLVMGRLG